MAGEIGDQAALKLMLLKVGIDTIVSEGLTPGEAAAGDSSRQAQGYLLELLRSLQESNRNPHLPDLDLTKADEVQAEINTIQHSLQLAHHSLGRTKLQIATMQRAQYDNQIQALMDKKNAIPRFAPPDEAQKMQLKRKAAVMSLTKPDNDNIGSQICVVWAMINDKPGPNGNLAAKRCFHDFMPNNQHIQLSFQALAFPDLLDAQPSLPVSDDRIVSAEVKPGKHKSLIKIYTAVFAQFADSLVHHINIKGPAVRDALNPSEKSIQDNQKIAGILPPKFWEEILGSEIAYTLHDLENKLANAAPAPM